VPFNPIPTGRISDPGMRRVLQHANNFLADAYTMLGTVPAEGSGGGRCNFSIALVLACVIDGLATEIYPIVPSNDQYERIRALLGQIPWGTKAQGWITQLEAAKVLYTDVRNPLVHNLGADTRPRVRREGFSDPAILNRMKDGTVVLPDQLEAMSSWNMKWPVVWALPPSHPGKRRMAVSNQALYWHVKWLTSQLAGDTAMLAAALKLRKKRRVK
jgi:hypothetical protein